MRISRALKAALLVIGVSATGAMASPLIIGPTPVAPVSAPKVVTAIPVTSAVQTQVVNTYRQLRSFWLSRAIVR